MNERTLEDALVHALHVDLEREEATSVITAPIWWKDSAEGRQQAAQMRRADAALRLLREKDFASIRANLDWARQQLDKSPGKGFTEFVYRRKMAEGDEAGADAFLARDLATRIIWEKRPIFDFAQCRLGDTWFGEDESRVGVCPECGSVGWVWQGGTTTHRLRATLFEEEGDLCRWGGGREP